MIRKYFLAFGLTLVTSMAAADENASNPLAAVNNVDLRWQFTSADAGDRHDVFVDGAYMVLPELKVKYELHYNFTDVTGSDENDFEKLVIKPIYFPFQTKLNDNWGLRAAVGFDWIVEFDNEDKGIVQPAWGQMRLVNELAKQGISISPAGVRSVSPAI